MLKELNKGQRKNFCKALGQAFSDYDDLNMMTRLELDTRLATITRAGPLDEIILDVVEWAQMNGQLDALIKGALTQRPGNPWLIELAPVLLLTGTGDPSPELQQLVLDPNGFLAAPADNSGLQGIVLRNNALQDVGKWRARMDQSMNSVCRFEVTNVQNNAPVGIGSGFLIADDLVLTNRHVVNDFYQENAAQPMVRFDVRTDADGEQAGFALEGGESAWLKGASPVEALDYAIIKLPRGSGRMPIPTPQPYSYRNGDVYFILQHPSGKPMEFGSGTFVSLEADKRLNYTTNTEPGSSGSPVFTQGWQPVALHREGKLGYNSGVPLMAVVDDARAAGSWPG
jgi:V8-like Glu-specific endopeptidase